MSIVLCRLKAQVAETRQKQPVTSRTYTDEIKTYLIQLNNAVYSTPADAVSS